MQYKVVLDLVAPGAPPRNLLPGEQLRPRHVPAKANDPLPRFIGLAGMLPPGRDDQAGYDCANAPGLSPRRQQANFGVRVRPIAAPETEAGI